MNLELKNRLNLQFIFVLGILYLGILTAVYFVKKDVWYTWDFRAIDKAYRYLVSSGNGPLLSNDILYVPITDASYQSFGTHIIDRKDLAKVNDVLGDLGVAALAYDVIFARSSDKLADEVFRKSLVGLSSVYLPSGFSHSSKQTAFKWESGEAYHRFDSEYLASPTEMGDGTPFYASTSLMQLDDFALAAAGSGHISSSPDSDGVSRHIITIMKIDGRFFPTLSLAMYLDRMKLSLDDAEIVWGKYIRLKAGVNNDLEKDLKIPIDQQGRTYIPFPQQWSQDFEKISAHKLITFSEDQNLSGNLSDLFEDKFVFIGDISIGTSDLGRTPLEAAVPLIVTHTAFLNALLNQHFYRQLSPDLSFYLVLGLCSFLIFCACINSNSLIYFAFFAQMLGVLAFFWHSLNESLLIPVMSLISPSIILFFGLIIMKELLASRDRAFIKSTFSRYLPESVVNHLLANPELLILGGEEKNITVLFSDIEGFTSIAEKMNPEILVRLLNEYLTEMTTIILDHGGIIDKYQGDSIMAEFGAPLDLDDHAEQAVKAAIKMQQRLQELRCDWERRSLPQLSCRIGINTGQMIIGNMGSDNVFDYTVIGDSVNLAARLESANKQYGTSIMISEFTKRDLPADVYTMRLLDTIKVKGKKTAVKVYEVIDRAQRLNNDSYYAHYEEAYHHYLKRDFGNAKAGFTKALLAKKNDLAAQRLLQRVEILMNSEPPSSWDGAYEMHEK